MSGFEDLGPVEATTEGGDSLASATAEIENFLSPDHEGDKETGQEIDEQLESDEVDDQAALDDEGLDDEADGDDLDDDEDFDEYDDDESDDEDESDDPDEKLFDVTVDGEQRQVTEAELKQGYAGQTKINEGLADLAENRKVIENYGASLLQERQQLLQQVEQLEVVVAAVIPQEPDWKKLSEDDPVEYQTKRAEWDQLERAVTHIKGLKEQANANAQQSMNAQNEAFVHEEMAKVMKAIPELKGKNAGKLKDAMKKVAINKYGFTDDEVTMLVDSRLVRLLHDATKFDAMARKGKKLRSKQRRNARKATQAGPSGSRRPSKKPTRQSKANRQRFNQTGDVRDAASVIEGMLD